jgi:hypothetical protein
MTKASGLLSCAALILSLGMAPSALQQPPVPGASATSAVYACPMHPDATANAPGTCPRCGMALVATDPFDAREYLVNATTVPRAVRAGEPFKLQLTVREPVSRAVVRDFATVHDMRFHLFVISQDLEHYAHVHPDQRPDGSWALDVELPKPGYYKLYSDFLPMGGAPQVIAMPLVTAGFRGDIASSSAVLAADRVLEKTTGSMRVKLALPEGPLVAGREETFAFDLTDVRTGAPVTDIEPYLAAWGHTLLISQDTLSVVHAHPVELVPDGDASARGGPVVTFKALFPKAGHYRLWTQMKRNGDVVTAMFTVNVASPIRP